GQGQRLLAKNGFPRLRGKADVVPVGIVPGADVHRVHGAVPDQLVCGGIRPAAGGRRETAGSLRYDVEGAYDPHRAPDAPQRLGVQGSDAARTDKPNPNHGSPTPRMRPSYVASGNPRHASSTDANASASHCRRSAVTRP